MQIHKSSLTTLWATSKGREDLIYYTTLDERMAHIEMVSGIKANTLTPIIDRLFVIGGHMVMGSRKFTLDSLQRIYDELSAGVTFESTIQFIDEFEDFFGISKRLED